ncbi:hypothetical protein BC937DRAFT_88211 [Endogone sp. FLAS-F59071]|nr:hypothetical protein BC937DRAFT_88211 [Endogone sp. FLAS-F59071]|eukprot:RUS18887.1 hypothetical protein BC937DRAFT_88211 [Endogone sp. FLAS-F59071]
MRHDDGRDLIKSVIRPIGYGNFQQLLREYRSKMVTINQFIDRLIQLFEKHQRLDMARGFKVFIPLKHQDLFQSAVNNTLDNIRDYIFDWIPAETTDIPTNDEQAPDSVLSASKRKGDDSRFEFPSSDSAPSASKRKRIIHGASAVDDIILRYAATCAGSNIWQLNLSVQSAIKNVNCNHLLNCILCKRQKYRLYFVFNQLISYSY